MAAKRRKGDLLRLAQIVIGQPHMIDPRKADDIMAVLGPRLGLDVPPAQVSLEFEEGEAAPSSYERCGAGGEIAVIPIHGTLVQRAGWLDAMSGLTSYQAIRTWVDDALADPSIKGIVFDVDSGGGQVNGCFDLVDYLYSRRGEKPMVAVSNESCFSAAYALASSAHFVWLTRTAGVGSIGVIAKHVDRSEENKMAGRKVSTIYAGPRKADLDPDAPMTDEAAARLQAEVDRVYSLFADTVARNRAITAEAVTALESGVRFGPDALDAELADRVGTLDEAVSWLAEAAVSETTWKEATMAIRSARRRAEDEREKTDAEGEEQDKENRRAEGEDEPKGRRSESEEDDREGESEDEPKSRRRGKRSKRAEQDEGEESAENDDDTREASARIVELCSNAGVPEVAANFIRRGMSVEAVKQQLDAATDIRRAVSAAHRFCKSIPLALADEFIRAGTPLSAVHRILNDKMVDAAGPEISNHRREERVKAAEAGGSAGISPKVMARFVKK